MRNTSKQTITILGQIVELGKVSSHYFLDLGKHLKNSRLYSRIKILAFLSRLSFIGKIFPSMKSIAEEIGTSINNARHLIREMRKIGLIDAFRNVRGNGSQTSNIYRLNDKKINEWINSHINVEAWRESKNRKVDNSISLVGPPDVSLIPHSITNKLVMDLSSKKRPTGQFSLSQMIEYGLKKVSEFKRDQERGKEFHKARALKKKNAIPRFRELTKREKAIQKYNMEQAQKRPPAIGMAPGSNF